MSSSKRKKPSSLSDVTVAEHFTGGASNLVFWSFRYFLGRHTAATIDFAESLAKSYPYLDEKIQELIRRELNHAFAEHERIYNVHGEDILHNYSPLGMGCDRAAWQLVRDAYTATPATTTQPDKITPPTT